MPKGGRLFHTLMHKEGEGGAFPTLWYFPSDFPYFLEEVRKGKQGMEPWKAQQNEASKAKGVWFSCFMVHGESFSILPANKQQSMSGAKALLTYTAIIDEGEMQQVAIIP